MNDFKFKLDAVLRLRERDRDEAAAAVQQAGLALLKLNDQISGLHHQHTSQQPLQITPANSSINSQRMLESQRYQMQIAQEIKSLTTDKQRIEGEYERRRMVLVEKEKQVRSLQKLKDKQLAQHQLNETHKEQAMLDQWAGFQHWKSAIAEHKSSSSLGGQGNYAP